MDTNAYNLGAYDAGTTNNLAGLADGTGYFGTSTDTNDIFGQLLQLILINAYYGDTNFAQGTTFDTGAYDPNLYGCAQVLPGTTTDVNALYGTAQTTDMSGLYGTTETYGTTLNTSNLLPGATTTTTTTQTTYDTTGVITTPGVVTGLNEFTTIGNPVDYTLPTALPVTTTTAIPATTTVTSVTQPVATLPPPVAAVTTVTPPVATVTRRIATVTPPVAAVTTPLATVTPPVAAVTTPITSVTPPVAAVTTPAPTFNNTTCHYCHSSSCHSKSFVSWFTPS